MEQWQQPAFKQKTRSKSRKYHDYSTRAKLYSRRFLKGPSLDPEPRYLADIPVLRVENYHGQDDNSGSD